MREIKFRMWRDGRMQGIHTMYSRANEGPCEPQNFALSDDEVLMQYTGLKDKNGKEIYEGDILHGVNKVKKIVKWDNAAACFIYEEQFSPKVCRISFDQMNRIHGSVFNKKGVLPNHKVIGNIYENPDLLNQL